MPDWHNVPIDERPFASPDTATCRKCRNIWRHLSETAIPEAIRNRADLAEAEERARRRARAPIGQRPLFPLPTLTTRSPAQSTAGPAQTDHSTDGTVTPQGIP
ncbi:hypothetical protein [Dactylosporangium sp. CA-139066]|uniref:hypothetical protein n=1 Tax=Dactylosporangium sp. CA-139066 TaxID=3239930 RepID=UPI003D8EAC7C